MTYSFEDIAKGDLELLYDTGTRPTVLLAVSLVARSPSRCCSFALHLVADKSLLFSVCTQLSLMSDHLIVITPHKRPNIEPHMGWTLLDEQVIDRVRLRLYRSAYCSSHAS